MAKQAVATGLWPRTNSAKTTPDQAHSIVRPQGPKHLENQWLARLAFSLGGYFYTDLPSTLMSDVRPLLDG
jgi:hypothetical protein